MVNNNEYFKMIDFDPTQIDKLPPPSSTVVYSRTARKWSVRDAPEGTFVPKGKIMVTNNTFNNLPIEMAMSNKFANQKECSMTRKSMKDIVEPITPPRVPTPEPKPEPEPESEPESEPEVEPEAKPEPEPEQDKYSKWISSLDKKQVKKIYKLLK